MFVSCFCELFDNCQYRDCVTSNCVLNWQGFGRMRSWPNTDTMPDFAWRHWGRPRKPSGDWSGELPESKFWNVTAIWTSWVIHFCFVPCYILRPSFHSWFDYSNCILRRVSMTELLTVYLRATYFLRLRSGYSVLFIAILNCLKFLRPYRPADFVKFLSQQAHWTTLTLLFLWLLCNFTFCVAFLWYRKACPSFTQIWCFWTLFIALVFT